MNKNDRWKFIFVVLLILWSLYQTYPPTSRDLVQQFASRAQNQDATFTNILAKAEALQQANTNRATFAILTEAIGTNDIQNYFPFVPAKSEPHPTTAILNQLQRDASGRIKLGLDLQGGTAYLVAMDTNYLATAEGSSNQPVSSSQVSGALAQAVGVLHKRVDALGVAEPVIQPQGENEILIQMPGLAQSVKEDARRSISQAAYLEFRMVSDNSEAILQNHEPIPPGYEVLQSLEADPGQEPEHLVVKKKAENGLSGDFVKSARVVPGNMGEPLITFDLTPDGANRFAQVTTEYAPDKAANIYHRMAIVLDGELYSAPTIDEPIVSGSCQISGHFTDEEAQRLASVLENPLRAPLQILSSYDVDPTL